jgi:amino acid permease
LLTLRLSTFRHCIYPKSLHSSCRYLIFVPQNLYEATRELFGWEVNKSIFLIAMILVEIPISWIRDIRKLTPFNVLASFLIFYGLASCLLIAFSEIRKDPDLTFWDKVIALPPTNGDTWFLFIGTAVRRAISYSLKKSLQSSHFLYLVFFL